MSEYHPTLSEWELKKHLAKKKQEKEKKVEKMTEEVLLNLKKVGIRTQGFFILGLPGETKKTIQQTIEFALKNPFDRAYFSILTPYPGSEIFAEYFGDKKLDEIDWKKFDLNTGILEFNDFCKEDLFKLQKKAMGSFYNRPKIFCNVIAHL